MKKLGYSATWKTTCFIDGGCKADVFAHTNGYGDFVLFDKRGNPWPIHPCYKNRSFASHSQQVYEVDYQNAPQTAPGQIRRINADKNKASYNVVGTITRIENGAVSKFPGFQDLDNQSKAEIKKKLNGRTSILEITDYESQYLALFDSNKNLFSLRDMIICRIKTIILLNTPVFVITQMEHFKHDSE